LNRLLIIASLLAVGALSPTAGAERYPSRPITIIVPLTAGTTVDVLSRIYAEAVARRLGQPVVVVNKAGAGGMIAAQSTANAAPDGYTIQMANSGHVISGLMTKDLGFDVVDDFAGIAMVGEAPALVIVSPKLGVKNLQEFVARAKTSPGAMNYGSGGVGSATHLAGAVFLAKAGVDMVHVPYKGAPEAILSIIRKESQLFVGGINLVAQLHETGKVFAMAVATAERSRALPGVPTVSESGLPDFIYDAWFGVLVPVNTPIQVVEKINRDIADVMRMPDVQSKLEGQGIDPVIKSEQEFNKILKADFARYEKLWQATSSK